jgi:single-stranded DNA-binding protein
VQVDGQYRSYNYMNKAGNKLFLTVFARDIRILSSLEQTGNPNTIYLNGFLCKPPIYRTTPFGREIADILLAVNRPYNKSDYIPCILWGRNARFCETLKVGDNLKIWGRVQSREYEKKLPDGTAVKKTAYEVSVSKLETVGPEMRHASP